MYRVYWKRNIPGETWNSDDINDWHRNHLIIRNQPTFQEYLIKVVAINGKGEANVAPKEVIGYSGEDGECYNSDMCHLILTHLQSLTCSNSV